MLFSMTVIIAIVVSQVLVCVVKKKWTTKGHIPSRRLTVTKCNLCFLLKTLLMARVQELHSTLSHGNYTLWGKRREKEQRKRRRRKKRIHRLLCVSPYTPPIARMPSFRCFFFSFRFFSLSLFSSFFCLRVKGKKSGSNRFSNPWWGLLIVSFACSALDSWLTNYSLPSIRLSACVHWPCVLFFD